MAEKKYDVFGIEKIFPNADHGEKWELGQNIQNLINDPRFFSNNTISDNQDGSWKISGEYLEFKIRTSAGYDISQVTEDHGVALKQGYMFTPKDWKNTETTIEIKINSNLFGNMGKWLPIHIYGPSGRNSRDLNAPINCLGDAYFANLNWNYSFTTMGKEPRSKGLFYKKTKKHNDIGSLLQKWARLKVVMYNINNNTGKRIELYVDKDLNNNFKLVDSLIDTGGWSKGAEKCGSPKNDQPIVWGGPQIGILCGAINHMDIRNFSVREIAINIPPDPSLIATPLDNTVASSLFDSTAFLYTGPNAIQTGVTAAMDRMRVGVLRGKVMDREGNTLPGVKISILNHPEFGETLSRADGMFDIVANGGGILTVKYDKTAFLPAQRRVKLPWQDSVWCPDVVLISFDEQVTSISLSGAAGSQIARGGISTDSSGSRQPTLIIPENVTALVLLPDGSSQPFANLNIRCTEYTIGSNGPSSMPAELPPSSGYTYAAELSVDEVISAGPGSKVIFTQPIYHYLENFLNFPVGTQVPIGYYDIQKAAWMPSDNGRVIKVISISNSMADLDTNGDDAADDIATLSELGITNSEQEKLAELYQPGESLWRVPITHLSPVDCNWPFGFPAGAGAPGGDGPSGGHGDPDGDDKKSERNPCNEKGSIIACQSQVLGQELSVIGTPYRLRYQSDRVLGRKVPYTISIPLSGITLPGPVMRIELEIYIAGKRIKESFEPLPNQSHEFYWDGKDAYGNKIQGVRRAVVRVGYVYEANYMSPSDVQKSFGNLTSSGSIITNDRVRQELIVWSQWEILMGGWDTLAAQRLGGWSLNIHHAYDLLARTFYGGDGNMRRATGLLMINTVAGGGSKVDDGVSAIDTNLTGVDAFDIGSDGSIYLTDVDHHRIRKISPNGIITSIAGTGTAGFSGDGGLAVQAKLGWPSKIKVGPDDSVYVVDLGNGRRIRRIGPDGIINTVVGYSGSGVSGAGDTGDGGPATEASLLPVNAIELGPENTLYISTQAHLRKVENNGIINTIAKLNTPGGLGDGGLMSQASFVVLDMACSDDSLYISSHHRIRRIGPDGIINTVAGNGASPGPGDTVDGVPATEATLGNPTLCISSQGIIYIGELAEGRVRQIQSDGIIRSIAGTGDNDVHVQPIVNGIATKINLSPRCIALGPDDSLYILSGVGGVPMSNRIYKASSPFPGDSLIDFVTSSEDGQELYVFSASGKHLKTVDALTGTLLYQFDYTDGNLTSVTDAYSNKTLIQRDTSNNTITTIAAGGQTTTLRLNPNGFATTITNPANETCNFTYKDNGLMETFTDANQNLPHIFTYDDQTGRLHVANNPAGGSITLSRVDTDNSYIVTEVTALSHVTTYLVEDLPEGGQRRVTTHPSGSKTEVITNTDETRQITMPDGTTADVTFAPDPRWGGQVLLIKNLIITPPLGSPPCVIEFNRTIVLSNPNDPFSLKSQTETFIINGISYSSIFDALTKEITTSTPDGFKAITSLDSHGRIVKSQLGKNIFEPVTFSYYSDGRLEKLQHGTQFWVYSYGNKIQTRTNAAGRSVQIVYDDAGRPKEVTIPSTRKYNIGYDSNGNLEDVTMPKMSAIHTLDYSPINLNTQYTTPPPSNFLFIRQYDTERKLDLVTLPTGRKEDFVYDDLGRLGSIIFDEGEIELAYETEIPTRIHSINCMPTNGIGESQNLVFEYDGFLTKSVECVGSTNGKYSFTYNNDFLVQNIKLNADADVVDLNIHYTNDGLLTQYGDFIFTIDGQAGYPTNISDGVFTLEFGYDSLVRLSNRTFKVNGEIVYQSTLTFNNLGQIRTKFEKILNVVHNYEYEYDLDGRLTLVKQDSIEIENYTYDENGNRDTRTINGDPIELTTYDNEDRIVDTNNGNRTYQYNPDGCLTNRSGDQFEYNTLGELIKSTVNAGTVTYSYDGLGRRVSRVDGLGKYQYFYGNPKNHVQVTAMRDPNAILTTYFYDEGGRLFAFQRGNNKFYVATDHLGTPHVVTDSSGTPVKIIEYDSFGRTVNDTNPNFDMPLGFAGGVTHSVTDLVHFGLRDYEPETGRWTSRDRLLYSGRQANLYSYVNNNPINLVDPLGVWGFSVGISAYAWLGTGMKLTLTDQGLSSCVEAGVGIGASIEIDPFAELMKEDDTFTIGSKISASAHVFRGEASAETVWNLLNGCKKNEYKGKVCVTVGCLGTEGITFRGGIEYVDEVGLPVEGWDMFKKPFKMGKPGELNIGLKSYGKYCNRVTW